MATGKHTEALQALGFSEIEALIYCFLLEESPATGYRISHAIGKAAANTYKAISNLARKGAIVIDDGDSRLCRAVPPKELLDAVERRFQHNRNTAQAALDALAVAGNDSRIYQLRDAEQVLTRARSMIAAAEQIILMDVFPGPYDALVEALDAAAGRGVDIGVEVYTDDFTQVADATYVRSHLDAETLNEWPGQQLNLAVDAREHMLALFTPDGRSVVQAVWSNSLYLSCLQHSAIAAELCAQQAAQEGLYERAPFSDLKKLNLMTSLPPGVREFTRGCATRDGDDRS